MNTEKYPEGYVSVKSICPNWVTENFLDFMNLNLEDLKGKNITSIGGGFGIFEMDMAKEGSRVTIVDPMFADEEGIDGKLNENIGRLSKVRGKFEDRIEGMKKEISKVISQSKDEKEKSEAKETLQWYNDRQADMREYLRRRKILLEHLNNWKENQVKYGVVLNPSSGDDIKGIGENSQDIVVIGHTLGHIYGKSFGDISEFLKEGFKLLKSGGKLYIIDYVGDIFELERMLEKTDKKIYYRVNKGSFVCCFDKEGLGEFLNKELK